MKDIYIVEKIDRLEQTIEEVRNLLDKTIEQVNLLLAEFKEE